MTSTRDTSLGRVTVEHGPKPSPPFLPPPPRRLFWIARLAAYGVFGVAGLSSGLLGGGPS